MSLFQIYIISIECWRWWRCCSCIIAYFVWLQHWIVWKKDIATNILFEAIVISIKKYLFCQHVLDFVNKLEWSSQKYQANVNVWDEKYKGKFLFPMKEFLLLGTYLNSIYFMSTIFLKDDINGVRIPQFQLDYIFDTINPSHKSLVKLCREVHYMWWENQYLELQEWEDCINSNKTIILSIMILVPNKNPYGYKEHVIFLIDFAFG